jgi:ATP-citrate lyase alpha-subunit
MSILADKETRVVIQGGPAGVNAARRMAEFSHLCRLPLNVLAFVFPPDAGKTAEIPYGAELISIPIFKSVTEATGAFPAINTSLIYVGPDRAAGAAMEALKDDRIRLVSMITEGVPEKDAKTLSKEAKKRGKIFNGPSAIGIISAGECRLGVVGGAFDNLILSKLHRQGSFGVITKSGGLSNEIMWICSQFADGVTTAIGIGGDAFPGSDYVTYLEMFENDPQTKAVVIVGEMGGELEEKAADWYAAKRRRIKLIAAISGFCQEHLPKGMKFGHAGAKEGVHGEGSARGKAERLKKAGAIVPVTFGGLGLAIKQVYEEIVARGGVRPVAEVGTEALPKLPKPVEEGIRSGEVFVEPLVKSTICDDRGDEPLYAGYAASDLINKGYHIPHVIGLLWNKKLVTPVEAEIMKRIIMLSADHGPCVSGALVTIVGACAGIQMAQAVAAGMLMIGPRFGGAVTDAGRWFKYAVDNKLAPQAFLDHMKANVGPVPGIGHRVKSLKNPDKRVKELVGYVKSRGIPTPHLDFALEVEKLTTAKKDTLILNVDGAMAAILVDLGFPIEALNGFFVLSRTIGLIGHWIDQNRQGSRLVRLFTYLANYASPKRREVPPLDGAGKPHVEVVTSEASLHR